jgi:hypothetical protein
MPRHFERAGSFFDRRDESGGDLLVNVGFTLFRKHVVLLGAGCTCGEQSWRGQGWSAAECISALTRQLRWEDRSSTTDSEARTSPARRGLQSSRALKSLATFLGGPPPQRGFRFSLAKTGGRPRSARQALASAGTTPLEKESQFETEQ